MNRVLAVPETQGKPRKEIAERHILPLKLPRPDAETKARSHLQISVARVDHFFKVARSRRFADIR
jgi:hypothetical protein